MPETFRMEEHGPRKLRIAILHGLIFGSFSEEVPPIDEYLGEEISSRIERVLGGRKPVVLGRVTQVLPNNWKLYMENVKDSYHASILHLFFTTFELNRLSQKGAHHRRRERRPSRQLFRDRHRGAEGRRIRQAAASLGKPVQAGRSVAAAGLRRISRTA